MKADKMFLGSMPDFFVNKGWSTPPRDAYPTGKTSKMTAAIKSVRITETKFYEHFGMSAGSAAPLVAIIRNNLTWNKA